MLSDFGLSPVHTSLSVIGPLQTSTRVCKFPGARTVLLSTPQGPHTPELQREVKSIPDSHTGFVHQVGNATRGERGYMSFIEEVKNSTELLRSAGPEGEASTEGWRPQGPSMRMAIRVRAGLVSTGSHQDVGRGGEFLTSC